MFDPKTGFYIRSGLIENGKETDVDPFMRNMPNLLDIGIMGKCKNRSQCTVGCYQGKNEKDNMTLENFKKIIDQCREYVFSVALGGSGSPNEHENFEDIVKYAYENKVVPNYTTSGIELTDSQIQATKDYCGAVAVSWYKKIYTYNAISRFLEAGCKTNVHYVLGNDSIDEAIFRIKTDDFPAGINAVLFLLYKPVGCVKQNNVLQYEDPRVKEFFKLIETRELSFKVGLDACSIPAVMNLSSKIDKNSTTSCDGASFSAYITPDMNMIPCSFDNQKLQYAVSLNEFTIEQAWNSQQFEQFRNYHRNSCPTCPDQNDCKGGCPITQEINICNRKEKCYHEV
ncbi:MAG TPA: SPASM domain-containing protein [Paludibacter sp.]|nr:SPASM domain-containing protein [Paludibacter sp.]